MSTSTHDRSGLHICPLSKSGLAAAAAAALVAVGAPLAFAAPTAVPPSDSEGYLNSTARCASPDTAVLFGATESSRVAICESPDGAFEYRGVRVGDGAKLIAPAKQTSANSFVVNNDAVRYTVTATALSVTANGDTFRTEIWTDYHGPKSTGSPAAGSSAATTPGTSATSPSASAGASTSPPTPTSSPGASLSPPLPAEVGGRAASDE
ncbi:MAG: hypothetical protein FGM52_01905 [Mycobacterium sp.]|nr:hypothetical protein [Mycobacterium sp.]